MKKFGKFERQPVKAVKKQKPETSGKSAKEENSLLRVYFTSLMSLVLCVAMFLGTSYAWFTSEVTNTQNEIYIGTLDVGMFKKGDAEWLDLAKNNDRLFDGRIRWEPGYTSLETVRIVNKGDLAFKYVLTFTDGRLTKTGENTETAENAVNTQAAEQLLNAAKWFEVYVYNGENPEDTAYEHIKEKAANKDGWEFAGTLDELLKGGVVLDGQMTVVREQAQQADAINPGTTDGKATEAVYTIALHMKEEVNDPTIMGQKISLNVKLVAYQLAEEKDDSGNKFDQMVATAEELREAFRNGGTVALAADIDAGDVETLAAVQEGQEVVLYLNGHSITANLVEENGSSSELFYVYPGGKLTIHGDDKSAVHVVAAKSAQRVSAVINNCGGTVVINGGKYTMEYGSYADGYLLPTLIDNNSTLGEATVIINGGEFTHTRNMFRNFANHSTDVARIIINSGIFNGAVGDVGTIWNQKASADTPAGAGKVEINGGVFNHMNVCTGFAEVEETPEGEKSTPAGVTLKNDFALGEWIADGAEWIAEIINPVINEG